MIEHLIVDCRGGPYDGTIELHGADTFFPQSPKTRTPAAFFAVDMRQKFENARSKGQTIVGKHFATKGGSHEHFYEIEGVDFEGNGLSIACRGEGVGPLK